MNVIQLFDPLEKLTSLKLTGNECINENLTSRENINSFLVRSGVDSCEFCVSKEIIEMEICEMTHQTRDNTQYLTEISSSSSTGGINAYNYYAK